MKCYNCDYIFTNGLPDTCPNCKIRINKNEYNLTPTSKVLDKIKSKKDFANFIGLPYMSSIIPLAVALIAIAVALVFLVRIHGQGKDGMQNRIIYMVCALVFIFAINGWNEMRKTETYYKEFLKGNNRYIAIFAFTNESRTFVADSMDFLPTEHVLKERLNAYTSRNQKFEKELADYAKKNNLTNKELRADKNAPKGPQFLRFKMFGMYHPQKPKMFMNKDKFFAKFFNPKTRHFIKTGEYNDESYVKYEGALHGFLMTNGGIITLFNVPKQTREIMGTDIKMVDEK